VASEPSPVPLDPEERLIWFGQPDPHAYGLFYGRAPALLGFFGFLFGAFILFPEFGRLNRTGIGFGPLLAFTSVFLAITLAIMFEPARLERSAKRVRYAITDRRAIVKGPHAFWRDSVFSVDVGEIAFVERYPRGDGIGDVYFFKSPSGAYIGLGPIRIPLLRSDGFIGVRDPEEVERLLWKAMAGGTDIIARLARVQP
jgi:hypothetical protein